MQYCGTSQAYVKFCGKIALCNATSYRPSSFPTKEDRKFIGHLVRIMAEISGQQNRMTRLVNSPITNRLITFGMEVVIFIGHLSDIWYIHFLGVKRIEFDEEFVIVYVVNREATRQWSRPMVRRGVARSIRSRRLMGLIRLKYVHKDGI